MPPSAAFGSMRRFGAISIAFALLVCLPVWAESPHPLAPPKTDSPRDTLRTFLWLTDEAVRIFQKPSHQRNEVQQYIKRATACLNLSEVPPNVLDDVGLETVLLLKDILDRVDIPPFEKIPDEADMMLREMTSWTLPHTEIAITKVADKGGVPRYLFSPATVGRAHEFYQKVRHLPNTRNPMPIPTYELYTADPGGMIPHYLVLRFPNWARVRILGQMIWKWMGTGLVLAAAGALMLILRRLGSRASVDDKPRSFAQGLVSRLLFPVGALLTGLAVMHLVDDQINMTGTFLNFFKVMMMGAVFVFAVLTINALCSLLVEAILLSQNLRLKSIDANLVRLVIRSLNVIFLFVLFWYVTDYIGLPVTAIFASAGIAGVAIALAARETLANFFGGFSILLDRPFKMGDYIVLDSGERGEVVDVGLRSTRIMTRDDVQISVPNSIITNTKIINESAPLPRLRVRIRVGVAYGTDLGKVEEILLNVTRQNRLVAGIPEPRVRFRRFGDSSLELELLCWAHRPHDKGRLIHDLNHAIYRAFDSQGIVIPYPQRDVHLHTALPVPAEED